MKTRNRIQIFRKLAAFGSTVLLSTAAHAALVGYWNFDANSLAETSGYKPAGTHDGIAVGDVNYTVGVRGSAGALDMRKALGAVKVKNSDSNGNPDGNYQNTYNELLYNSTAGFSIAFWAKSLPIQDWQPWISRRGEDSWGYQVRRPGGNDRATFTLRSSTGGDDPDPTFGGTPTAFSDGRWHQITAVYDRPNGRRLLYVDGVAEIDIADTSLANPASEYLMFGARHTDSGNPNNFESYSHVALDEIQIYDNALTAGEVQGLIGDPWIYVDSTTVTMTNGGSDIVVTVTVPPSLVATSAVEVVVTSPNPAMVDLVGGTAGVLKLQFPAAGGNVQTYSLHPTGPGMVTVQHTSTNAWVDGAKDVIVWPAAAAQPTDDLVAYWNFNSDSLAESGGYAPSGLLNGLAVGTMAYTAGPAGRGHALALTNANSAVRVNNSGHFDRNFVNVFDDTLYTSPNGFSISFWAKNLPGGDWRAWIAKKGEDSWGYQVRKLGGGPSATFTLRNSDGADDPGNTTTDFSDGRWHHIAAVYDPVNFRRILYIDGVAQIDITDGNLSAGGIAFEHLLFGGRENDYNNPQPNKIDFGANIYLDEIRVFKKAMSVENVLNEIGSIVAAPASLSLISPSPNNQFVTVTIPPSLVATSSVSVVVTSDNPAAAVPEGAVAGVLTLNFSLGGAHTAQFAVQANGPGTAHFTYACAVLPSAAFTTVAVSQPNIYSLVGYWNFNAQTLTESSGFQPASTHDGQAIGTVAYVPGLGGGYALDLRQPNTEVRINNSQISDSNYRSTFDQFLFGSSQGFTLACWVRGVPSDEWQSWLAKDGESFGYALRRVGANGVTMTVRNSDGDDDPSTSGSAITDSLWHHITAIYDPINSQRRIYIDGVELLNIFDATLTQPPTGTALFFGARELAGNDPRFARVVMDEVRIYDKALSVPEIEGLLGPPMIAMAPAAANLNVGDPSTTMITVTVPASLVATSAVSVTLTTANVAVAKPVGATGSSLVLNFPMGGGTSATVGIQPVGVGTTYFTATSPQATVNGDTLVSVVAPVLLGHWISGAAGLADTSGYRPAGTHDGAAVGATPGNLAYSPDVPAGFPGQSLDLTAGSVAVAISNSASADPGYLDTYDNLVATNLTIAFWSKGLPGTWRPWITKRGEDDIGYQVRRHGNDAASHATFTLRGTAGNDDPEGATDISDAATTWHHFAAIWNSTLGIRQLYIDGVLDTGVNLVNDLPPLALASGYHLMIGARENSGHNGIDDQFAGLIYDVRVYQGTLSEPVIKALLVPPPALTIQPWPGNQARISWSTNATGFALQATGALPGGWTNSGLTVTVENTENAAYAPVAGNALFYRLIK